MPEDAMTVLQDTGDVAADWPRVRPYGGSKWAAFFGGPLSYTPAFAEFTTVGQHVPLGVFLSRVLPAMQSPAPALLSGPPLTPAQRHILERLGWLNRYVPQAAEIPAFNAPAYAALMALLRAAPNSLERKPMAILPPSRQGMFSVRNRASLVAWLRARRIAVVEDGNFEALGAAGLVLVCGAAQAGLLGLCQPGTKVLELAPEGWVTSETRAICSAAGLGWNLFLATAPSYPLLRAASFGSTTSLSYEIPIATLGKTLASL